MEEASLEGNSARLYQLLRKLKPFVPRRDIRLLDSTGQPAGNDWDERMVVKDAFKPRLEATECSFESIIDDDRRWCAELAVASSSVTFDVAAIPTL